MRFSRDVERIQRILSTNGLKVERDETLDKATGAHHLPHSQRRQCLITSELDWSESKFYLVSESGIEVSFEVSGHH